LLLFARKWGRGAGFNGAMRAVRAVARQFPPKSRPLHIIPLPTEPPSKKTFQSFQMGNICANCHAPAASAIVLHRCEGCLDVRYCGRECQIAHWNAGHRHLCRTTRAVVKEFKERLLKRTQRLDTASNNAEMARADYEIAKAAGKEVLAEEAAMAAAKTHTEAARTKYLAASQRATEAGKVSEAARSLYEAMKDGGVKAAKNKLAEATKSLHASNATVAALKEKVECHGIFRAAIAAEVERARRHTETMVRFMAITNQDPDGVRRARMGWALACKKKEKAQQQVDRAMHSLAKSQARFNKHLAAGSVR
jgi:hypothetical protein